MSRRDINNPDGITIEAALEQYRAAACAEADAVFDDRALEQQRARILARLAHLGNPAKVIRFPKGTSTDVAATAINRRWISVAAAAGLIIGLLGGQLVHLLPQQTRRLAPTAAASAPTGPAQPQFLPISAPVDDGLLDAIEVAMQMRGANELHTLDELTPLSDGR
jgi:hypothetical protein